MVRIVNCWCVLTVSCIMCGGCSRSRSVPTPQASTQSTQASAPSAQPTGKRHTVTITSVDQVRLPHGGSLVLVGTTDIPVEDVAELCRAADDVWGDYEGQAEAEGLTSGVIRISTPAGVVISDTKGYGFVYDKWPDGTWHRCKFDK